MSYADVIERLEKATGPSMDLSRDTLISTGLFVLERRGSDRKEWLYEIGKGYGREDPAFIRFNHVSKSLDASISLVERMLPAEGFTVTRYGYPETDKPRLVFSAEMDDGIKVVKREGTLAIALLIAMFRALEAEAKP